MDDIGYEAAQGAAGGQGDRRARGILAALVLAVLLLVVMWWYLSRTALVPDVIGLADDRAKATIVSAGFVVGEITTVTATSDEAGTVVDQDPYGGTRKVLGSAVDIQVGAVPGVSREDSWDSATPLSDEDYQWGGGQTSGPAATGYTPRTVSPGPRVPQVFDMTVDQARAALRAAGYRLGSVSYGPSTTNVAEGRVFNQDPAPDSYEPLGTLVDIWVSSGSPGGYPYPEPEKP